MSEKKGISAFLQKNKKKGAQGQTSSTAQNKTLEEQAQAQKNIDSSTQNKQSNVESSDEEEDDVELNTAVKYGNIKEKKDVMPTETEENKRQGYGFLDEESKASTLASTQSQQKDQKQKKTGEIQFGKPSFGKKKQTGKFAGDFEEGLEDIDDDGNVKKKDKFTKPQTAAEGLKEFVNLGSNPRGPKDQPKSDQTEPETKKEAVKPTFRGKLNLKKAENEQDNSGVVKSYDFNVTYKTEKPADQEGNEKKDGEREKRDYNKDGNQNKNKFQGHKKPQQDDEDEWNKVEEKDRKRKPRAHKNSDSDEEQIKFQDNKGRGRGGFHRGGQRGGGDRGARGRNQEGNTIQRSKQE